MLFINSKLLKQYGKKIPAGYQLFQEGQEGKTMYVIYTGKIEISKIINGQSKVLTVLGDSEFFGEMALLNNEKRSASARALALSEVLEIDQIGFENLLKKSPEIALSLVRGLSDRLRDTNKQLDVLIPLDPIVRVCKIIMLWAQKAGAASLGKDISNFAGPYRFRIEEMDLAKSIGVALEVVHEILDKMFRADVLKKDREFIILENEKILRVFGEYLQSRREFFNL